MLVLFETAAGYAIFKLLNEKKLKKVDNLWDEFSTPEKANETVKLLAFEKFKDTAEAVESVTALTKSKFSKTLKKLLKKAVTETEQLAVGDAKLGSLIKEKFNIECLLNNATAEVMRGIRAQLDSLLGEHRSELAAMSLGLAHSLGRYRVKFNPEKIDTMIVQAVSLLDDLDKELNNYAMRTREWYGWHFPELGKLITDHQAYAKVIKTVGMRQATDQADLSAILPDELEQKVKHEAEMSMGTDISDLDLENIRMLCDQVLELGAYRTQLFDYLKNRMMALAPNLTVLLGELVGARLISHAGSLVSLAKYPASTVQILGAEKALFRALKTKRDTPKYGLIYHAQLIGQAGAKSKGKIARKLAAKASLAIRVDALAEDSTTAGSGGAMGAESRAYLEAQIRQEQERGPKRISGNQQKHDQYKFKSEVKEYDDSADTTIKTAGTKRRFSETAGNEENGDMSKKRIKTEEETEIEEKPKKKKKKRSEVEEEMEEE